MMAGVWLSFCLCASSLAPSYGLHKVHDLHDLARKSCRLQYDAGIHLVQLEDIGRQFLLAVPNEIADGPNGVPLVVAYHGYSDSPWYTDRHMGFSTLTDRYGWLGILPFGFDQDKTNGLAGVSACCPEGCDEECCKNGLDLRKKDETACGWKHAAEDLQFTEAIVHWATSNACVDGNKVFATGFSNGASFVNSLGCKSAHLFRAVAPISGDDPETLIKDSCSPSRPISFVSMCGSKDDEAYCQRTSFKAASRWGEQLNCTAGIQRRVSATSNCTEWSDCEGGNFVETCESTGLGHDVSGHLRPDDTSYIRPGSDLDFSQYVFQKFSLFVGESILFFGHPTDEELAFKESQWPPPRHDDHMDIRQG